MKYIATYQNKALTSNDSLLTIELTLDDTLENNTWDTIAKAFKLGVAPSGWLGQTKQITSGTYNGYHLQLVDNTANRYERADGTGYTKAVFQFVEILYYGSKMYSTDNNSGGWADSIVKTTKMPEVYADLPSEIKAIITECEVLSSIGGGSSTTSSSNNNLFLPSEYEVFGSATYSIGSAEGSPQYTWWAKAESDKKKHKYNENQYMGWWLRSPYSNSLFCLVGDNGTESNGYASTTHLYAPAFAI